MHIVRCRILGLLDPLPLVRTAYYISDVTFMKWCTQRQNPSPPPLCVRTKCMPPFVTVVRTSPIDTGFCHVLLQTLLELFVEENGLGCPGSGYGKQRWVTVQEGICMIRFRTLYKLWYSDMNSNENNFFDNVISLPSNQFLIWWRGSSFLRPLGLYQVSNCSTTMRKDRFRLRQSKTFHRPQVLLMNTAAPYLNYLSRFTCRRANAKVY